MRDHAILTQKLALQVSTFNVQLPQSSLGYETSYRKRLSRLSLPHLPFVNPPLNLTGPSGLFRYHDYGHYGHYGKYTLCRLPFGPLRTTSRARGDSFKLLEDIRQLREGISLPPLPLFPLFSSLSFKSCNLSQCPLNSSTPDLSHAMCEILHACRLMYHPAIFKIPFLKVLFPRSFRSPRS
ncbi:hypothetical protein BOTBODRAFT_181254 [Botryobasidium botryosum FD-172 SS1]|uniref:Uncharacterized protein n=1 Tax=Botryobasidium botryosum (strain FD-172 SS1) TaxID=930990 RepID=A0A067LU18_BOTB1|nr:hypothetical protein BOTBODRAFT_181254 [Botryobasidium botryosum FD-172 SS1]